MAPIFSSLRSEEPDDAIKKVQYWDEILKNCSSKLNCSITDYKQKIEHVVEELKTMADVLDKLACDVGISKATGGGASILGGTMALGGLILAPFTAGASLTLTVGGIALGTAGGITSLGATLAQHFTDRDKLNIAKTINEEAIEFTNLFREVLKAYMQALVEFQKVIEKQLENQKLNTTVDIGKGLNGARNLVTTTVTVTKNVKKVITYYKDLQAITTLTGKSGSKTVQMLIGSTGQLATDIAAPGVKIGSKVLVTAGGTGARVLSASFSALGIGMGIWDCIDGADSIKNGSEHAKMFRESACCLDKAKIEIIELYDGLFG